MKDPVVFNASTGLWHHPYSGKSKGWRLKRECAEAYVKALIQKEPKYKPLFEGKKWSEIFKMVGIVMENI